MTSGARIAIFTLFILVMSLAEASFVSEWEGVYRLWAPDDVCEGGAMVKEIAPMRLSVELVCTYPFKSRRKHEFTCSSLTLHCEHDHESEHGPDSCSSTHLELLWNGNLRMHVPCHHYTLELERPCSSGNGCLK